MAVWLAQENPAGGGAGRVVRRGDSGTVVLWAAILIGIVLIGAVVIFWIRRNLLTPPVGAGAGGIMDDLRKMREQGQISQEEYDRVRKNMAARLAKSEFGMEKGAAGPGAAKGRA